MKRVNRQKATARVKAVHHQVANLQEVVSSSGSSYSNNYSSSGSNSYSGRSSSYSDDSYSNSNSSYSEASSSSESSGGGYTGADLGSER